MISDNIAKTRAIYALLPHFLQKACPTSLPTYSMVHLLRRLYILGAPVEEQCLVSEVVVASCTVPPTRQHWSFHQPGVRLSVIARVSSGGRPDVEQS